MTESRGVSSEQHAARSAATRETLAMPSDPEGVLVWDWMAPIDPAARPSILVLINGYQRHRMDFRAMRRRLHEQCPWLASLALDNRGVGETHTSQPFTLADMEDDVVRVAKQGYTLFTNAKSLSLLGISMGGMIAQGAARKLASLSNEPAPAVPPLARLFLVSTTAGGAHRIPARVKPLRDRRPADASNTDVALPGALDQDFAAHRERMRSYFGPKFLSSAPLVTEALAKSTYKTASDPKEHSRAEAQAAASRAFDGSSALADLRSFGVPCTVLCGDEDAIMPIENSHRLAGLLGERAETVVYPGAGHLLLIEEPEAFASDVASRLTRDRR